MVTGNRVQMEHRPDDLTEGNAAIKHNGRATFKVNNAYLPWLGSTAVSLSSLPSSPPQHDAPPPKEPKERPASGGGGDRVCGRW